jgi:hypothetical protein
MLGERLLHTHCYINYSPSSGMHCLFCRVAKHNKHAFSMRCKTHDNGFVQICQY